MTIKLELHLHRVKQALQLIAKKTGNCQNKMDTFLQCFHIFKNYLTGIVK
jgi:hypothetical protein